MFSFDIVSTFDKSEMNNTIDQAKREMATRYDFKGTSANLDFENDKKESLIIEGDNQFQLDSILDIVRKKSALRGISQKTYDITSEPSITNLKYKWQIKFIQGLDQPKAKKITAIIKENFPKLKHQIQGDAVRVSSNKKDELQAVMKIISEAKLDFPVNFTNFR